MGDILVNLIKTDALIPMRIVGPIKIIGDYINQDVKVPLATFETPLWASIKRGASVTKLSGGIRTTLVSDCMTRSVIVKTSSAKTAITITKKICEEKEELINVVKNSSRYAEFLDIAAEVIGNLIYLRIKINSLDAAGHNMVTKAAEYILNHLLKKYNQLQYVTISGNYCTDKKNSAINGLLGRGKNVIAEATILKEICINKLRATPKNIVSLNINKNLLGSILAGSVRSANAHFANTLLAFYLAIGQDAANIVEGSQGFVMCEETTNGDLNFSVTVPNIIVGTIGNGKDLPFVQNNLKLLGCNTEKKDGYNSKRLAEIIAATILCGELSLLAAQTNQGELIRSHVILERKK